MSYDQVRMFIKREREGLQQPGGNRRPKMHDLKEYFVNHSFENSNNPDLDKAAVFGFILEEDPQRIMIFWSTLRLMDFLRSQGFLQVILFNTRKPDCDARLF